MTTLMGPVLGFRGSSNGYWHISVLMASTAEDKEAPLQLTVDGASESVAPTPLKAFSTRRGKISVRRYDCKVKCRQNPIQAKYSVGGCTGSFHVPASDAMPRMLYASCNGFSSLKLLKNTEDPNALWRNVAETHQSAPYNVMLLGGDQIYFDSMWDELPALANWASQPLRIRVRKPATAEIKRKVDEYYRDLYLARWSQPEFASALANIPSLMMWDDHDIFDGWGSYPPAQQSCDVYQTIFRAANEYFCLYQHQVGVNARHPLSIPGQDFHTLGCQAGGLAILALDMRSERTDSQVISHGSWRAIYEWLDSLRGSEQPNGVQHLFVMSSIPVVHPDFGLLERALGVFPGQQELEDDLRDHWSSIPHRQERLRLIHRLLALSNDKKIRITILSGDVHVGAVGAIQSERSGSRGAEVINQLTSSGIVHPPPPGMVLFFLEHVIGKDMDDDRDIVSEITELPGTRHHFIGARNWLSLEPDDTARYWANWYVERQEHPFTKVIHPVNFQMAPPK